MIALQGAYFLRIIDLLTLLGATIQLGGKAMLILCLVSLGIYSAAPQVGLNALSSQQQQTTQFAVFQDLSNNPHYREVSGTLEKTISTLNKVKVIEKISRGINGGRNVAMGVEIGGHYIDSVDIPDEVMDIIRAGGMVASFICNRLQIKYQEQLNRYDRTLVQELNLINNSLDLQYAIVLRIIEKLGENINGNTLIQIKGKIQAILTNYVNLCGMSDVPQFALYFGDMR